MQHSIQRAAVWILDQYYCDFVVYNPALLNLPKSILSKKASAFKVYSLGEGKRIGNLQLAKSKDKQAETIYPLKINSTHVKTSQIIYLVKTTILWGLLQ